MSALGSHQFALLHVLAVFRRVPATVHVQAFNNQTRLVEKLVENVCSIDLTHSSLDVLMNQM